MALVASGTADDDGKGSELNVIAAPPVGPELSRRMTSLILLSESKIHCATGVPPGHGAPGRKNQ